MKKENEYTIILLFDTPALQNDIKKFRLQELKRIHEDIIIGDLSPVLKPLVDESVTAQRINSKDFKKIIFTFLTFVFTSVLIRVLAKNVADTILLPDTIILLLVVYCLVSVLYYFYARWELDNKLKFFDEQYNKTRSLYKEILSDSEMSELFMDEKKNGTYVAFQKERKTRFRNVWLYSVAIVILGLLIILGLNHIQPLYEIVDILSKICKQLFIFCNR